MLYLVLKWLHVLAAVVAVGSNLTYGIWIARASRERTALPFTLRGIKRIDDRLANPAYGVLMISGLLTAFVGRVPLSTPWLLTSLILFVAVVLLGLLGFTPTLRSQIQVLDSAGVDSPEYRSLARRGTTLGILIGVLTVVIIFFMVVKPPLWA